MNSSVQNPFVSNSSSGDFEETLRLIARISAPEGLEERVQAGLRTAKSTSSGKARILAWPVALRLDNAWAQSNLARTAAAAAIVAVVVGGGWGVSSRFHPAQPSSAVAVPPHNAGQGGFSSAGAMRTPQTLNGPVVAVPEATHPATIPQAQTKATANAHAKTHARHGKSVPTKNPIAPTTR
ncbi:MAG: hypothetical protein WCA89_15245 [Terracidiphilus sp.]|jgi:hypothetical protein